MKRFILILVLTAPAIYTCFDIQDVKAGEDVTLQCVSVSGDIRHLEWTREDILDGSVFYYQNNKVKETYMDPRFHGRVMLKHPQTAHIVVGNVTVSDSGVYECWVKEGKSQRRKRDVTRNGVVKLRVTDGHHGEDGGISDGGISDGGSSDGGISDGGSRSSGSIAAVVVVAVAVAVAVAVFLVVRRRKSDSE